MIWQQQQQQQVLPAATIVATAQRFVTPEIGQFHRPLQVITRTFCAMEWQEEHENKSARIQSPSLPPPSDHFSSASASASPSLHLLRSNADLFHDEIADNANIHTDAPFGTLVDEMFHDRRNDDTDQNDGINSSSMKERLTPLCIGQYATIRRVFSSRNNAAIMLTCGGPILAKHASFDPHYPRAQQWIRSHAVGPAVLSPVLLTGLIGSLVESIFPHSTVPVSMTWNQVHPLIVGVPVYATITVMNIVRTSTSSESVPTTTPTTMTTPQPPISNTIHPLGSQVELASSITQVRDRKVMAQGSYTIWIPNYLSM
jgi:hypothetical protein